MLTDFLKMAKFFSSWFSPKFVCWLIQYFLLKLSNLGRLFYCHQDFYMKYLGYSFFFLFWDRQIHIKKGKEDFLMITVIETRQDFIFCERFFLCNSYIFVSGFYHLPDQWLFNLFGLYFCWFQLTFKKSLVRWFQRFSIKTLKTHFHFFSDKIFFFFSML